MLVSDLHENFGALVSGVKLTEIDTDGVWALRQKLAEKGLLLFREQFLEDKDLVAFGRKIGNGKLEPSARKISHGRSIKEVVYLSNLRYEDGGFMGFPGKDTDFWHSDQEFRENPAILASIYCVMPSPIGGQTSFASTAVGNLGVNPEDVALIRGKWSTRVPAATHDNVPKVEVAHPAILTNPHTGEDYIYVSDNLVRYIDIPEEKSAQLKENFMGEILKKTNIYAHDWRAGDYVLYDNSQVIHRREAFDGARLLKATKIYTDADMFAVPDGFIVRELSFERDEDEFQTAQGKL